jgi:acetyl-CoA acetyltransferase
MIHVRHAAAAIASGLCETVLIAHGESGPLRRPAHPQCRRAHQPRWQPPPFPPPQAGEGRGGWANGAADFVHDPGIALHEDLWPDAEQLAMVSVVQREWAAKNPRATFRTPTLPAPRAAAWR